MLGCGDSTKLLTALWLGRILQVQIGMVDVFCSAQMYLQENMRKQPLIGTMPGRQPTLTWASPVLRRQCCSN